MKCAHDTFRKRLISRIDELHGLSNRNIGAAHAILLHKTETTRSARWGKFNTGESISSCCRLTAHFPALWFKFQPPGSSREIVSVPAFYHPSRERYEKWEQKLLKLQFWSRAIRYRRTITRLSRLPDRPQFSAHSRFFFYLGKKLEGAPDVLFQQCYSAGSRVKVPRYFQSPKKKNNRPWLFHT